MSWFGGIIAFVINVLASGVNLLIHGALGVGGHITGTTMGDVILGGFFPQMHVHTVGGVATVSNLPAWGAGTFSNLMSAHATSALQPFAQTFWVFGWTFFALSIYLLATSVSGASESAVQRDRLKKGIGSLFVAALFIWQGERFAVLITQFSFYSSWDLLRMGHFSNWTGIHTPNALLNSIVKLLQAVLSFIVWIVYRFRALFLDVWMVFFPLAMAFYANEKTRGIAKMWWTEWIYQMLVPLGQALVFGIATALTGSAGGAADANDVFSAIAGTIGLLSSAVYVRKIIELIAQNFGASMMGSNHGMAWGTAAMAGGAAITADVMGKGAVKTARATAGKAGGTIFNKLDNSEKMRSRAEKAVGNNAEVHAGSIMNGASMDDILMSQKLGGHGDALHSGGAGIEGVGGRTGGMGRSGSSGSSGSGGSLRRHGGTFGLPSGTVGELGSWRQSTMNTLRNSNMGTLARSKWEGFKNSGGVMGKIGDQVASTAEKVGNSRVGQSWAGQKVGSGAMVDRAKQHQANRTNQATRVETLRSHLRETMQHNELAKRLPGISEGYNEATHQFEGVSAAEKAYGDATQEFVQAFGQAGKSPNEARSVLQQAQAHWDRNEHLPNLHTYTPQVLQAYQKAFTAYRPAKLDTQAKEAVQQGRLSMVKSKNPHQHQVAKTPAFLNDARNALMYRR